MKMMVVYKIQNLVNGKVFVGKHSTNDLFFANPACRLSELTLAGTAPVAIGNIDGPKSHVSLVSTDTLPSLSNNRLRADIQQFGKSNFRIESLAAGVEGESLLERMYQIHLQTALSNPERCYNASGSVIAATLIARADVGAESLVADSSGVNSYAVALVAGESLVTNSYGAADTPHQNSQKSPTNTLRTTQSAPVTNTSTKPVLKTGPYKHKGFKK